jgi:hypothetical protein
VAERVGEAAKLMTGNILTAIALVFFRGKDSLLAFINYMQMGYDGFKKYLKLCKNNSLQPNLPTPCRVGSGGP